MNSEESGQGGDRKKWGLYKSEYTDKVAVCKRSELHEHDLYSESCKCSPMVIGLTIKHREMVIE